MEYILLGYHLAGRGRFWGLIDNKEGIAITAKHRSLLALPAALMAKYYLSIQTTSVPSEQAFSIAKNTISLIRNRLDPEKARASLCLKS